MLSFSKLVLAAAMLVSSQSFAQWEESSFGREERRPPSGQACFFENANFNGRSFCLVAGQRYGNLEGYFNDQISSISVQGNLRVSIYTDANFRGSVATINRDVYNLNDYAGWNDRISSIIVDYDNGGPGGPGGPGWPGGPGHGGPVKPNPRPYP